MGIFLNRCKMSKSVSPETMQTAFESMANSRNLRFAVAIILQISAISDDRGNLKKC